MSVGILEALAVCAEMTGTTLSKGAMQAMELELRAYPEDAVMKALRRCMRECKHRLTLADVIERLQGSDGRPTADEAWSIALVLMDEAASSATTDEIMTAWGAARTIYQDGDKVGARMAFRAAYEREVGLAREAGKSVLWRISEGTDKRGREMAARAAVEARRLTNEQARRYLPAPEQNAAAPIVGLLTGSVDLRLSEEQRQAARGKLKTLRDELARGGVR